MKKGASDSQVGHHSTQNLHQSPLKAKGHRAHQDSLENNQYTGKRKSLKLKASPKITWKEIILHEKSM